jgi:adenylate cyclase
MAHAFGGRSTEALACIDYGTRLSPRETGPTDYHLYYAFAYFQGAQYERGLQFAQQAHRMRPSHVYPLLIAAACAGHLGKTEAATMLIRDIKAILPVASRAWVEATSPYVHAEDRLRLIEGLGLGGLD